MGRVSEFQALMRDSLMSTTVTVIPGHICAITLHVGPPTYPAPMQQIRFISNIWKTKTWASVTATNHKGIDQLNQDVIKLYNSKWWMQKFDYSVLFGFFLQGVRGVLTFSPTGLCCREIAPNELITLIFLSTANDISWLMNLLPRADEPGL